MNSSEIGSELSPEDWERDLRAASNHGVVEMYHEACRRRDADPDNLSALIAIAERILFERGIEY